MSALKVLLKHITSLLTSSYACAMFFQANAVPWYERVSAENAENAEKKVGITNSAASANSAVKEGISG